MTAGTARAGAMVGTVEKAYGPVVNVRCRNLPPIGQALDIIDDHDQTLVLEIRQHLSTDRVCTMLCTKKPSSRVPGRKFTHPLVHRFGRRQHRISGIQAEHHAADVRVMDDFRKEHTHR